MLLSPSTLHSLRRVFHDGFSVHDIAEPLISYGETVDAEQIGGLMTERKLAVIGVRRDGLVAGFAERDQLQPGPLTNSLQPFSPKHVVEDTTPLAEVILGLKDSPRLFVTIFGQVGGIVTRTDLQKPPVRMWLFGMVTLIEMRMTYRIGEHLTADEWRSYLSEGRLQKAEALLDERSRRDQSLELLDCLQFADKCQIIARDKHLREDSKFGSRRQLEETAKKLERLRNNLAHSQDILATDWEAVVELSENLDELLEDPVV